MEGENFRPMFDSDAAWEAAEYFKELIDYSPRGILNMSWFDRAVSYAEGNCAMAHCATLLAPLFELDTTSPAFEKTEYLPPYNHILIKASNFYAFDLGAPLLFLFLQQLYYLIY